MVQSSYLDFDLLVESSKGGHRARVVKSPCGQAVSEFTLPMSDLELENFLLRVGRSRSTVRRGTEAPEKEAIKAFGGALFESVFSQDVLQCFSRSLDEAKRKKAGLRIRLSLGTPELADIPWEYLYNSESGMFLCLTKETPLVRYIDLPEIARQLTVKPPLRILVMISSPTDYPRLDADQEWLKLKDALSKLEQDGRIVLDRVPGGTLESLTRRLQSGEYHIFHFVGHGGFDPQTNDGALLFEGESGRGSPLSGADLGMILHDYESLRLAVLNACEGARSSRTDPFSGAAQSLVRQGIPAVLAMQFEITDEAAITLAHEFYTAVAKGYPIDHALAVARRTIFSQRNEVEWGTPVLFMRSPNGRVFKIERPAKLDSTIPHLQPESFSPSPQPPDTFSPPQQAEPPEIGNEEFISLPREEEDGKTVRHYRLAESQLAGLTLALSDWFRAQGFDVQVLNSSEGTLIQARKMAKKWQKALGLSQALNVGLLSSGDNLKVSIGAGKWMDRATAAGVGMFVAWPALVTATVGWLQERALPERVFGVVDQFVYRKAGTQPQRIDVGVQAEPRGRFCEQCGSQLSGGAFCVSCGHKVA